MWTSVRPRARLGIGTLLAALLAVLFVGVVPSLTAGARSSEADDYVARINALRTSVGVQSLAVDGQLDGVAQSCADRLASSLALIHTSNLAAGISSDWTKLGENIGMGPRNDTIWTAFVHSAEHYTNLVDPAFNRVGVGVAYGGGSQWTCHRFMAVSGGGDQPAAARTPAAARPAAPKSPRVTAPPAPDPAPVVTLPPRPMPGPPPPADSARVAAVLQAMHALSTDAPPHPSTDSARVAAVLQAMHALSTP
ncbi:MAG: CAP domain-containing protein [Acidimicrobiales bacterium]